MRKVVLFVLPLVLLLGFATPSAQARDHHRGRYREAYRHGYVGNGYHRHGYYRHGYYGGRRYHGGYWRYYRGRRYWYDDGVYYVRPGGVSINIGF